MKKQEFVLLAALLASTAACAQDGSNMGSGVFVGAEGDYVIPSSGNLPAGFHATSHDRGVAAGRLLLGYQFNSSWGVELAYLDTGDYHLQASKSVIAYQATLHAKGEDLALRYRFTGMLPGLFVKAGWSRTQLQTTAATVLGTTAVSKTTDTSGIGYLFGAGYEFDLAPAWSARLGYTRYMGIGGQDNIKLHVVSAGVTYRF